MKNWLLIVWVSVITLTAQAQTTLEKEYSVLPVPAEMQIKAGRYLVPDTLFAFPQCHYRSDLYVWTTRGAILNEINLETYYNERLVLYLGVKVMGAINTKKVEIIYENPEGEFYNNPNGKFSNEEYYELEVNETGIYIHSGNPRGVIYAFETLRQLAVRENGNTYLPYCSIKDYPDYAWRGLLLDVCRHFMPMSKLYNTIDMMVACKMNVLHLHLSDDQAFRVECETFPLLHQKGSNGQYYTKNELYELQTYAQVRGIEIIPEFDIPGHTTAWLSTYPEYASLTVPKGPETGYGIFKPVMDPTNEKLYKRLDKFFKEMSSTFWSAYMHIGGDEVRSDDWLNNPKIKEFMQKKGYTTIPQLQNYFNARVATILTKYNKRVIGWDEILEGKPAPGTLIQSWRGEQYMKEALSQDYRVIRSHGFYLDQTYTAGEYYSRYDTVSAKNYWGAEAAMWSELVDSNTVNSRLWPNAVAIADIYWRHPVKNDSISFYKRVLAFTSMHKEIEISHEQYIRTVLAKYNITCDHKTLWFCSFIAPIDGYRRHRMIKADSAYNTSHSLTTYADIGRPTTSAYMEFLLLWNQYEQNPSVQNKEGLEELLNIMLMTGDSVLTSTYKDMIVVKTNASYVSEFKVMNFAMQQCTMSALEWVMGNKNRARKLLIDARETLRGKEYELSIMNVLEKTILASSDKE